MNRWEALKTSTEPTFSLNVTCVGQVGRLGMPLASPIFCRFFKTIHDPLSEIPCPLGPNVNSWAVLGASREPTFPLSDLCGHNGQTGHAIGFPYFLLIFLDHSRPSQFITLPPRAKCEWMGRPRSVQRTHIFP